MIDRLRYPESRFIPVQDNVGITVNRYFVGDKCVSVINVVEKHEPKIVETSFGPVKNNTLSRISDTNFQTEVSAKRFISDEYFKSKSR